MENEPKNESPVEAKDELSETELDGLAGGTFLPTLNPQMTSTSTTAASTASSGSINKTGTL